MIDRPLLERLVLERSWLERAVLGRIADVVIGAPRRVLAVIGLLVVAAGLYGSDAAGRLSPAGYEVGGSEATAASAALAEEFDTGPANLVLLATADSPAEPTGAAGDTLAPTVDSLPALWAGLDLAAQLADRPHVADVTSYWATGAPQLRSADGRQALVTARIVASEDEIYDRAAEIRDDLAGRHGPLQVQVGGSAAANLEIVEESERDLLRAELIAIPLTTLIMLLVFRSVVAALLPLVVSAVAVAGTAAALKGLAEVSLVSIFALNLTTALGLGMGVDFSLFTISRWREERAAGADADHAIRATVVRAGRSVLLSGLTTAATLAALLLFDYPLLRSLAVAGFVVVLLAVVGALLALPAAMVLLGDRIDRFAVRSGNEVPVEQGRWYRVAQQVGRRPRTTAVVVVGVLAVLGTPFLRAQFAIPDDRALPASSPARQVADDIRAGFDARPFGTLTAVAVAGLEGPGAATDHAAYAGALSDVDGVARVETWTGVYVDGRRVGPAGAADRFRSDDGAWLSILPDVEPISPEAERMVAEIRAVPAPADYLLGGESARLVDNKAEIRAKLLPVGAWVLAAVGLLLYASFGSVLIPLKAVVLNLLSLTAAFGAIVWIFQDGRLSGVLGFTPTGLTDVQTPVLVFCIAFGLSMDYEVFLLSRVKEEWDATGDTDRAVAVGLQRTGGIITAAAVLMAVVFLSFATGNVTFIQLVGVGLALSIVADATLVRTFLAPAVLSLAGRWNWWTPTFPTLRPPPRAQTPIVEGLTDGYR